MVRKFGKIVVKPSKANPKWIEASYLTPVSAFSEWPDLPNRQTATFPCTQDGRDEAAAWLTRARRRIEADVWEPERIAKRKAKDTALTFGEYAAKWLKTREGEGLHVNTIYGIRCTVKRLIDAFGGMPIGKITSADIERYAATLPKDHPYVGRELLSKLRQILDAAATPDQDGFAVIGKSPFVMPVRKPAPREETPAATPQQLRRIHDAMPRKFRLAITLAISCGGLRIGEVCALQRGDIDLDNRLIHIRRTRLTRARVIAGPPKTARSKRTEPIPEAVIPEIRAHLAEYVADQPDAWIFPARWTMTGRSARTPCATPTSRRDAQPDAKTSDSTTSAPRHSPCSPNRAPPSANSWPQPDTAPPSWPCTTSDSAKTDSARSPARWPPASPHLRVTPQSRPRATRTGKSPSFAHA